MLVERKDLRINGKDFSSFFADVGYEVKYARVQGDNGGMMQSGIKILDTLKVNAVVTLPTFCLSEAQISELLVEIVDDYITLFYFDPRERGYKTISAIPSEPSVKYRGHGADANSYWRGKTITLMEQ